MSIEDLVARVVTAARAAFTQARELHPDESFYCYALYTDELAAYILPTCCSEEALGEVAAQYAEKGGGTVAEEARELRWNPPDWPHHMLGEDHFDGVLEALDARGDPWQFDDDSTAETDARFEACFRALAQLDADGFFGRDAERDQVIVTVLQGDQSDRSRLENARRLNPPAALARLEGELDVPEPIGDRVTLGSTGAYQITALAYAPGPRLLVACGSGGEMFAWDLTEDRELLAAEHDENYWDAVISADGRTLLVTDHDRLLRVDLPDGARHDLGVADPWAVSVTPDGAMLAAACGEVVRACAVATGAELWRLDHTASGLRFSGDGTLLALAGYEGVTLVDASDGSPRELVRSPRCPSMEWSPDDGMLATAEGESGDVRLWRRGQDGFACVRTLVPPVTEGVGLLDEPADLAFSPDGTLLAAAHSNGDVNIWEVATGTHRWRLRGLQEAMSAVVFIDDRHVAAAGRDVDSGPPVNLWTLR